MKHLLLIFLSVFCFGSVLSQELINNFEDGTLQGWMNIDNTETGITNEEEGGNKYLQKVADGSMSAPGRMSVKNETDTWTGDNYGGGFGIFGKLYIEIRNVNNFDLKIRLGFRGGSDDTILVSTEPTVIPANSDWTTYLIDTYEPTTVVSGKATTTEVATNTLEFRIIHSEEVSWEGDIISGNLQIDNLDAVLLNNEEFRKELIRISPNPFKNRLKIELPIPEGSIQIFDVIGRRILSSDLQKTTVLDLQKLNSGVYIAKITTGSGSITKRIIKN